MIVRATRSERITPRAESPDQAARAARRFPEIIEALADGRLHLSAVKLLAPHLTRENAGSLLRAAAGRTRSGIEQLLAERFPRPESLPMVEAVSSVPELQQQAPGPVQNGTPAMLDASRADLPDAGANGHSGASTPARPPLARASRALDATQQAPGPVQAVRSRISPVAADRFGLQVTISKATHDKLRHAQALLSHCIPAGDLAQVLDRVLDAAIEKYEKQKFAKTSKPRAPRGTSSANTRHIPAHVKRAVWERDQARCTFVSASGRRCDSRTRLEFDHVTPVAKGGTATIDGMRLRCRGHNQHEAEQAFGAGFMKRKREGLPHAGAGGESGR